MASDLTERLAAKLAREVECAPVERGDYLLFLSRVEHFLPLLLSEPELVASLPESVRLSVLTPRERAVMKLGEATLALHAASDEQFGAALAKRDLAVIEAIRALPPSPAPMEGRKNE